MFIFQTNAKEEPRDENAWFTDSKTYKKGEKALPDFFDEGLQHAPHKLLAWATSGYPKSATAITHYLNASGQDMKVSLTAPEWQFILHETVVPWEKSSARDDLQKYTTWEYKQADYKSDRADIPQEYKDFRARMAKNGFDLDKIENELKVGQTRSMEFKGKNGRIYRYAAEKLNDKHGDYMMVYVDRKWRAGNDGWERMDMVPGGKNSSDSSVPFTDAWNLLGYTTVARRKLTESEKAGAPKGAEYVYRVEETFDFAGSRSSSGGVYSRTTDKFTAKAIKKIFPKAVSLENAGNGKMGVVVNSQWLESVGKPFNLVIAPVYVNKFGRVLGEAKPQETKKPLPMAH